MTRTFSTGCQHIGDFRLRGTLPRLQSEHIKGTDSDFFKSVLGWAEAEPLTHTEAVWPCAGSKKPEHITGLDLSPGLLSPDVFDFSLQWAGAEPRLIHRPYVNSVPRLRRGGLRASAGSSKHTSLGTKIRS